MTAASAHVLPIDHSSQPPRHLHAVPDPAGPRQIVVGRRPQPAARPRILKIGDAFGIPVSAEDDLLKHFRLYAAGHPAYGRETLGNPAELFPRTTVHRQVVGRCQETNCWHRSIAQFGVMFAAHNCNQGGPWRIYPPQPIPETARRRRFRQSAQTVQRLRR